MKKRLFIALVIMAVLLMIGGCARNNSSEPITAKQFKTMMEDKGMLVTDQIDSANGDNSYQDIYVAADESKYSFEYYFMKDVSSAKGVYKYAVDNLEANYKDDSSAKIISNETEMNSKYEVSASDYYCVVWQNENAVLYLTAYIDYQDEAKQILKELGCK